MSASVIDLLGLALAAPALLMAGVCLFSTAAGASFLGAARVFGVRTSERQSWVTQETRVAARMAAFFAVLAVVAYFVGPDIAGSIAEGMAAESH